MVETTGAAAVSADVVVVGGGVAGSSVAAVLAGAGLDVVLVEREAQFRDRVRGECIHPWGVRQIEALGLAGVLRAAGVHELPVRVDYADRLPDAVSRFAEIGADVPNEWVIYHPAMQTALLEHARDSGVRVLRPARVTGFERIPEPRLHVAADDGDYAIHARLVIGADGRQSLARRWVGATAVRDSVHHQIGGCLLDGVTLADDTFHVARFEGGMVLVFPQGHDRARTYVVGNEAVVAPFRADERIASYINRCASAFPVGAFAEAQPAGPLAFFPNADIWSDRLYNDSVVLIGDAAGANDPSGGHGLSLTFRDVRELRDRLQQESSWDRAMQTYAESRMAYYQVLRAFQQWVGPLVTDVGIEADERRARAARAKHLDPTRGGFAALDITGPDPLVADDAARRHYLGEGLHHRAVSMSG